MKIRKYSKYKEDIYDEIQVRKWKNVSNNAPKTRRRSCCCHHWGKNKYKEDTRWHIKELQNMPEGKLTHNFVKQPESWKFRSSNPQTFVLLNYQYFHIKINEIFIDEPNEKTEGMP